MHPPVFSLGKRVAFFALPPMTSIYSLAKKKETSENTPSKGHTMSKLTQEEIDLLGYIQVCLQQQQEREEAEMWQKLPDEEQNQQDWSDVHATPARTFDSSQRSQTFKNRWKKKNGYSRGMGRKIPHLYNSRRFWRGYLASMRCWCRW